MRVMKTTTKVTKRAQTAIPAAIRRRYGIKGGDLLEWIDEGGVIKVVPVPADPIRVLRGCARGEGLLERLLAARREERDKEAHG